MRAIRVGLVSYSVAFFGTILLLLAALGLTGCAETIPGYGHVDGKYITEFDWEFDAQGVEKLEIATTNGNVDVKGDPSADSIRVHARMRVRAPSDEEARAFGEKVLVKAEREGSVVRAFHKTPRRRPRTDVSVSFTVTAPTRILDVELEATHGNVTSNGLAGAARLRTTNGNVVFHGSGGPFELETTNGNVEAVFARMVESGELETTNGSIRCTVRDELKTLSMKTTNGSIDLEIPPDAAGQLDARTTHGNVSSEIPVAVTESKRAQLVGPLGGGGPIRITARTTNGDIRLSTIR